MPPSEDESGSRVKQPESNGTTDSDTYSSPTSKPKKVRTPIRKILSKPLFSPGRKSKSDSDLEKTTTNENKSGLSDNESVATDESTPKKAPPQLSDKNSQQERSMWAPLVLPGSLPKTTNGIKSALKPKTESTTDNASSVRDKKKMIQRGLAALAAIVVVLGMGRWMGHGNNVLGADHDQRSKNGTVLDQNFLDMRLKVIEFETGL